MPRINRSLTSQEMLWQYTAFASTVLRKVGEIDFINSYREYYPVSNQMTDKKFLITVLLADMERRLYGEFCSIFPSSMNSFKK